MDKKLRLRRGMEQKQTKMNPRIRLKGEEEIEPVKMHTVGTQTVDIEGTNQSGFTVNKYTVVQQGDTVTFSNATTGPVMIQFQVRTMFNRDGMELGAAGTPESQQEAQVSKTAPIGMFCFAVFCLAGPKFAVANSEPIIIINPKDDR